MYYPQDIYPEIALSTDLIREGRLTEMLRRLDTWTLCASDAIVTLSSDMVDVIKSRGVNTQRLRVIRSFSAEAKVDQKIRVGKPSPCHFVFAGNIGRFQNLDALVLAFAKIEPDVAVLTLLGEGREKKRLQALVGELGVTSVYFRDGVSADEAAAFISTCDVGVVALRPEIYRYAFPAKFYTYLGAGVPILALMETYSELARLVSIRGIGEAVAWDDGQHQLEGAITRIVESYEEYRVNVNSDSEDLHSPEVARQQWLKVFEELSCP